MGDNNRNTEAMKILSYDPRKKKTILCGYLKGDTFVREVDPKKHFMKVLQGYGIQEDAFQTLINSGCSRIIMKTKTDEYLASVKDWVEHSKIADYSSGKQRFLSLKFMRIRKIRYEDVPGKNVTREIEYTIPIPYGS